jgi:hypothetical protein
MNAIPKHLKACPVFVLMVNNYIILMSNERNSSFINIYISKKLHIVFQILTEILLNERSKISFI